MCSISLRKKNIYIHIKKSFSSVLTSPTGKLNQFFRKCTLWNFDFLVEIWLLGLLYLICCKKLDFVTHAAECYRRFHVKKQPPPAFLLTDRSQKPINKQSVNSCNQSHSQPPAFFQTKLPKPKRMSELSKRSRLKISTVHQNKSQTSLRLHVSATSTDCLDHVRYNTTNSNTIPARWSDNFCHLLVLK